MGCQSASSRLGNGAAGFAGVWATDNTREALWDAMERKEVYATTGTRLLVRVLRRL